jgi:ribosomal protein S18 acetylase RimI-like enzyme
MQSASDTRLSPASNTADFAVARRLFEEYAALLGVDLCFQGFDAELEALPTMYGPPTGCLVLAWRGGDAVACGALRRLRDGVCEMKRLYVQPRARGQSLGRRMALALIAQAHSQGYSRMVLDTLPAMTSARALYRSLGFRETAPYYSNPEPGALYLDLTLGAGPVC